METMPGEILLHFCRYLADSHIPSLLAFALANRHCYSIASSFLFRTIKFELRTHDGLVRDIQECQRLLERNASFQNVRRLIVDINPVLDHEEKRDSLSNPDRRWHRPKITVEDEYGEQLGVEAKESHILYFGACGQEKPDHDWPKGSAESLARLVERLPRLSDLVYGSLGKFPPCLLQTLHRYLPQCRLRVKRFILRSLEAPVLDRDEFMLMTSPGLHAVEIGYGCPSYPGMTSPDFHLEALMSVVAGQAPNLKEVGMWPLYCPAGRFPQQTSWPGFSLTKDMQRGMKPFAKGLLQKLQISGPVHISRWVLDGWRAHTDFSVLRVLELNSPVDDAAMTLLAECEFPNLHHLSLVLCTNPQFGYYEALGRFLSSFSSQLSGLVLNNWIPPDDPEGMAFGANLRKLWLRSENRTLQVDEIEYLAKRCPLLEDLCLHIPRTKGDAEEVAFYRALGRFQRVQHLTLVLDAANLFAPDDVWAPHSRHRTQDSQEPPSVDELHERYPWYDKDISARLRDILVNSAVDAALARAIFRVVSSAKAQHAPCLPLQSLTVTPYIKVSAHSFKGAIDSMPYVVKIQRDWLVERSPRNDDKDDDDDALRITRLPDDRKGRRSRYWITDLWLNTQHLTEIVFRRLWPDATETGWDSEWRSWPLDDCEGDGEGRGGGCYRTS